MKLGLSGKVALVTGSGAGIGQAIAAMLAAEGAHVAVNDLGADRCADTVASIRETGGTCQAAPFDVTRPDEVAAGVRAAERELGPVDILVNNAAMITGNVPFNESRPEDWEREIRVALFGTLTCTHHVLAGMAARRGGRIINIVSDAARVGQEKEVVYSSAKGGIISFTKSLAREVGRDGITVNAVSPAATDTPLRRALLEQNATRFGREQVDAREAKIRRAYPMRRICRPEDTAAYVAFLASAAAGNVTGQICSVNAGFAMPG